jgi:NhaP-type Na+/H+ or K+/H+ antiporter
MSAQGKAATSTIFSYLLQFSDAVCFAILGLSLYSCIPGYWSWTFIGLALPGVILARFVAVFILYGIGYILSKTHRLTFRELLYIIWSGMVRGSVAVGLCIQLATDCVKGDLCPDQKHKEMLLSTTVVITLATTIFFGSTMHCVQSLLLKESSRDHKVVQDSEKMTYPSIHDEEP